MLYHFNDFMFVSGAKSPCYTPHQAADLSAQDKAAAAEAYPALTVTLANKAAAATRKNEAAALKLPGLSAPTRASLAVRLNRTAKILPIE